MSVYYETVDGVVSYTKVSDDVVLLGNISLLLSTYIVDNLKINGATVEPGMLGFGVVISGGVYEEYKEELVRVLRCGREIVGRSTFEYKRDLVTNYANMG